MGSEIGAEKSGPLWLGQMLASVLEQIHLEPAANGGESIQELSGCAHRTPRLPPSPNALAWHVLA